MKRSTAESNASPTPSERLDNSVTLISAGCGECRPAQDVRFGAAACRRSTYVSEHLVTGISQTSQPEHLEQSLCNQEPVDCDKLAVITKDSPTPAHDDSGIHFIHIHVDMPHQTSDTDSGVVTGEESILTDAGGVNVPNISQDTRFVGFFAHPHVVDHLYGWPIPEDEIENYNDAIDAGRSVVTYKAKPTEAPAVEQAFKDAGLKNVKTFESGK